jgi:hypothetical protein
MAVIIGIQNAVICRSTGKNNQIGEEPHELILIKMFGFLFFKIKGSDLAKNKTFTENTASTGLRQELNKVVLFSHT